MVQARPKLIVAVACERDLSSGIQDTHPLPVFGVINERPNGPCLDTFVNIRRLEAAIRTFLGLEADDASGGKGATAPLTPVRGESRCVRCP